MPAPSRPLAPATARQRGAGADRDVDGLIRELQRISLSQSMDQLTVDMNQLTSVDQLLAPAWSGLYVRCPAPDPGADRADKKSSSGYSTASSDVSGEVAALTSADTDPAVADSAHAAGVSFFDAKYASVNNRPVNVVPANGLLRQSANNSTDVYVNGAGGISTCSVVSAARAKYVSSASCGTESGGSVDASQAPSVAAGSDQRQPYQWRLHSAAQAHIEHPAGGPSRPGLLQPSGGPSRPGLLQDSVTHSIEQRQVSPVVARAAFCPPAASTPTLSPRQRRSPKTLRFASSDELIPSKSPSRRQVSAGSPPPPPLGILRSRPDDDSDCGATCVSHPGTPGWLARSTAACLTPSSGVTSSGSGSGSGQSSTDRISRVVSALSRLESELSSAGRAAAAAVAAPAAAAPAAAAELSGAGRAAAAAGPSATDGLLVVTSSTGSDPSDCGDQWPPAAAAAELQQGMADDGDLVLLPAARRSAAMSAPGKAGGGHWSWLLSCATGRPRSPTTGYQAHAWAPSDIGYQAQAWPSSDSGYQAEPWPPSDSGYQAQAWAPSDSGYQAEAWPPSDSGYQAEAWLPSDSGYQAEACPPSDSSGQYLCNVCKCPFCEHRMLVRHVRRRHMPVQMKPKYGCGLCPARFYASKLLARHCDNHHNSIGDKRTPQCLRAER